MARKNTSKSRKNTSTPSKREPVHRIEGDGDKATKKNKGENGDEVQLDLAELKIALKARGYDRFLDDETPRRVANLFRCDTLDVFDHIEVAHYLGNNIKINGTRPKQKVHAELLFKPYENNPEMFVFVPLSQLRSHLHENWHFNKGLLENFVEDLREENGVALSGLSSNKSTDAVETLARKIKILHHFASFVYWPTEVHNLQEIERRYERLKKLLPQFLTALGKCQRRTSKNGPGTSLLEKSWTMAHPIFAKSIRHLLPEAKETIYMTRGNDDYKKETKGKKRVTLILGFRADEDRVSELSKKSCKSLQDDYGDEHLIVNIASTTREEPATFELDPAGDVHVIHVVGNLTHARIVLDILACVGPVTFDEIEIRRPIDEEGNDANDDQSDIYEEIVYPRLLEYFHSAAMIAVNCEIKFPRTSYHLAGFCSKNNRKKLSEITMHLKNENDNGNVVLVYKGLFEKSDFLKKMEAMLQEGSSEEDDDDETGQNGLNITPEEAFRILPALQHYIDEVEVSPDEFDVTSRLFYHAVSETYTSSDKPSVKKMLDTAIQEGTNIRRKKDRRLIDSLVEVVRLDDQFDKSSKALTCLLHLTVAESNGSFKLPPVVRNKIAKLETVKAVKSFFLEHSADAVFSNELKSLLRLMSTLHFNRMNEAHTWNKSDKLNFLYGYVLVLSMAQKIRDPDNGDNYLQFEKMKDGFMKLPECLKTCLEDKNFQGKEEFKTLDLDLL